MTEPHPLRCETCDKNDGGCPYDDEKGHNSKGYAARRWCRRSVTSNCGCASHSDATSAEKVLDALEKIIETESWFALKAFVKELRQQQVRP